MQEKDHSLLETIELVKLYVRQQMEMGFDEVYLRSPSRREEVPMDQLTAFLDKIKGCRLCSLWETRTNFVFGEGNAEADIVFVGEAPGREEDLQGKPFVGRAGQLLTKIIESIHLRREDVYIANILKCRPPQNRDPLPTEIALCERYLIKQLEIIRPKIICALGRIAAQALLENQSPLSRLRGRVHTYHGIKLIATYHPAALLRYPQYKRPTWEDMQLLRREYDDLG